MTEILDNRYEIIRRLGSGGMADVFLARDSHLGRDVAIKILYKRYANDEEFVARFRQEAQSAAGLNHPHIVSIFDRGEAGESYYIAMEYLEGQSLKEVIASKGRLAPPEAIDIAVQILQALQFAHEHQVIHRDIKPHNIVINSRGRVKVTDFGIARAGSSSRMTETGSIIGTAQYLSPEQAKGKAVEQGSDLYSVGVVLYEMLTGKVPFDGENPVAIALMHLSDEPAPPQALAPEVPDNLNAVVMRALAKDPRDRYRNAEEFMADLERCRRDLPVTIPAPVSDAEKTSVIPPAAVGPGTETTVISSPPDGRGSPRRKKWLWLVLGLAAVLLAAMGIMVLAFGERAGGGEIEVPNVVGLSLAQAESAIRAQELLPEVEAEEFSETVPAGNIISQNPDAGARISRGSSVRLVLSKGSGTVAVPELVGQSAGFAESKLREVGLTPDRQPDVFSDAPAGNVISQDPPAGANVQKGSSVKYVVSKGPQPPQETVVPGVVGLRLDEARVRLEQAGLVLGNVSEQNSDSVPSGEILSQSPAAGERIAQGSAVSVIISAGSQPSPAPDTVSVPSVTGETIGAADARLRQAGLALGNVTEEFSPTVASGRIISQSPESGQMVNPGFPVNVVVSKGPAP
ncbi:MAG: Stk1 family PASTA domain-containing Ser/Thr kinase [Thermoleophilia bacterium]|nr:Stk1 family PASTA domain-containing Ser/Thr kinase [Thermoleophilia bacterium]